MAFYYVNDGVVDTAVSFEDGGEFAAAAQFMRSRVANELGNIDGNRTNVALGVASVGIAPDRAGGYEGQTYNPLAFRNANIEDGWFALEGGALDGAAPGSTVTEIYSIISGTASGEVNATASGSIVAEVYSVIPGAASGGIPATAPGATVGIDYSLIAGLASGQVNAIASGAILGVDYSVIPGNASGSGVADATAPGGTTGVVYSLLVGSAVGDQQPAAPGASWPAPSGYYTRKTKPKKEEIEEAAKQVAEIVSHETYFVSPQQIARMASALISKSAEPDISRIEQEIAALQGEIQVIQQREIKAVEKRKLIERQASALVAAVAYLINLQAANDDELLLLAVA